MNGLMVEHMTNIGKQPLMTRLRKSKLNEQIVARVKELIFSNQLRVGDKLPPERELMAQIGVSRAVVREALRSLEQSGLVEIRQGATGGAFVVSNLDKPIYNAVFNLYSQGKLTLDHFVKTRKAIECSSVREAAERATEEDIARLREINRLSMEAAGTDDSHKHRQHAETFHVTLAEISGNYLNKLFVQAMFQMLDSLRPHSFQTKEFKYETYTYHESIADALADRNILLCERLMIEDIERTGRLEDTKIAQKTITRP